MQNSQGFGELLITSQHSFQDRGLEQGGREVQGSGPVGSAGDAARGSKCWRRDDQRGVICFPAGLMTAILPHVFITCSVGTGCWCTLSASKCLSFFVPTSYWACVCVCHCHLVCRSLRTWSLLVSFPAKYLLTSWESIFVSTGLHKGLQFLNAKPFGSRVIHSCA